MIAKIIHDLYHKNDAAKKILDLLTRHYDDAKVVVADEIEKKTKLPRGKIIEIFHHLVDKGGVGKFVVGRHSGRTRIQLSYSMSDIAAACLDPEHTGTPKWEDNIPNVLSRPPLFKVRPAIKRKSALKHPTIEFTEEGFVLKMPKNVSPAERDHAVEALRRVSSEA